MISQIEKTILSAYLINENYSRTVTAHLQSDFFESEVGKVLSKIALGFTRKQGKTPSQTVILTLLSQVKGISEQTFSSCNQTVAEVFSPDNVADIKNTDYNWLLEETEKWCKERSVFNAILKSVDIIDGKDKDKLDKSAIPDLMQKALAISFDSSIGHNYIDDAEVRHENMMKKVNKIPFRVKYLNDITDGGCDSKSMQTILAGTGCHAKGTDIMLWDGSTKKIEEITTDDMLLGDDGGIRYVNSLIRNRGVMYRVTINSTGDEFVVNEDHILSLYNTESKKVVNISIKDYLNSSNNFKHHSKAYYLKQPAIFKKNNLKISPYFMGIYLGDGSTHNIGITNMDDEVISYFKDYVYTNYPDAKIRETDKEYTDCKTYHVSCCKFDGFQKGYNEIARDFFEYGLIFNNSEKRTSCDKKFIPNEYKTSSIDDRVELLSGIIDTDGYYNGDVRKGYEIVTKSKQLASDIKFVAQSLAMMAKIKEKVVNGVTYYRVNISESFTSPKLKCKVLRKISKPKERCNPLHSSFTLEKLGVDDYYGFNISHNNLYCMGNFMVTHNTGKSMMMCSLAADYISMGYDVLYITLEMSEEKISHRIDANLLDIELNSLKSIPRDTYLRKFEEFKQAGYGKLIVKEYPTSSASCANFRFLLQELDIKQSFKPKIVFLDYLGITLSSRFKSSENMYQIQKSVAEEFRGLAVEMDFVAWTATQINRGANGKSEIALGDISESFGINMSCDMVLGLTSTPELVAMNQLKIEQLKNRYTDLNYNSTKLLDVVRAKMRIYDNGRETIPYKKVKSTKFDNTLNKIESGDKPFVFDKSMIRPKKEYTKFNLE